MKNENALDTVNQKDAVEILQRNLGGDTNLWDLFFQEQLIHKSKGLREEIPVNGTVWKPRYSVSDIYRYIFAESPIDLGYSKELGLGSVCGSSFSCDASVAVDYEHRGNLVVKIETPQSFKGGSWISPDEARALATKLRWAANKCERDAFDVVRWEIVPKRKLLPFPVPGAHVSTGDVELDELLEALG